MNAYQYQELIKRNFDKSLQKVLQGNINLKGGK